jgi:hypothetical protein
VTRRVKISRGTTVSMAAERAGWAEPGEAEGRRRLAFARGMLDGSPAKRDVFVMAERREVKGRWATVARAGDVPCAQPRGVTPVEESTELSGHNP